MGGRFLFFFFLYFPFHRAGAVWDRMENPCSVPLTRPGAKTRRKKEEQEEQT